MDPHINENHTIVDFTLTQRGVRTMNRMRLIIQWLKESNDPASAEYESVVMEFVVPEVGQDLDPSVQKVLLGKNYTQYRLDGGRLNLN